VRNFTFESVETLSQAEFAEWIAARPRNDDPRRYELLNGRIVMNPPAGWPHGESELAIGAAISRHVRQSRLGRAFGASQGFELPSGDTVGPDVSYVSNARWEASSPHEPDKFLKVVPDLVVEVLSPSTATRDRGEKKGIYEQNGVREYWLVDTRARTVVVFHAAGGRFDAGSTFEESGVVRSAVLPELSVPGREIFGEP
jgi:Uma2 family endonuclease